MMRTYYYSCWYVDCWFVGLTQIAFIHLMKDFWWQCTLPSQRHLTSPSRAHIPYDHHPLVLLFISHIIFIIALACQIDFMVRIAPHHAFSLSSLLVACHMQCHFYISRHVQYIIIFTQHVGCTCLSFILINVNLLHIALTILLSESLVMKLDAVKWDWNSLTLSLSLSLCRFLWVSPSSIFCLPLLFFLPTVQSFPSLLHTLPPPRAIHPQFLPPSI